MPPPNATPVDFTVESYGTVFLIRAAHEAARVMLASAVEPDATWLGNALAVEPRFIGGLVSSLRENGWKVR